MKKKNWLWFGCAGHFIMGNEWRSRCEKSDRDRDKLMDQNTNLRAQLKGALVPKFKVLSDVNSDVNGVKDGD